MKVVSMNKSFGKLLIILKGLTNGIFLVTTVRELTSRRAYYVYFTKLSSALKQLLVDFIWLVFLFYTFWAA